MPPNPHTKKVDAAKPSASKPTRRDDDAKFPNLAAERDWDREQHIKQAMQSGMTRKQAERHADDELREG